MAAAAAAAAAVSSYSSAVLPPSPPPHFKRLVLNSHQPLPFAGRRDKSPSPALLAGAGRWVVGVCKAAEAEVSVAKETSGDGMNWVPVVPLAALPKGERRVIIQDGETILLLWYKDEVFAIENRSPAEGAYSEGLFNAKLTKEGCIVCPTTDSTFDLRTGDIKDWVHPRPVVLGLPAANARETPWKRENRGESSNRRVKTCAHKGSSSQHRTPSKLSSAIESVPQKEVVSQNGGRVDDVTNSNGGSAPVMTKVTNGEEARTLLKSWKKAGVFEVRGALPDFPNRLRLVWPQNPSLPKNICLAGTIQGEPARIALWLQFVSVLQQVSKATKETPSVTLIDCQTALRGLRGHGFETDIADMALEHLMTSKLAVLVKAKAANGGMCSHEAEMEAAKDAYEVAQQKLMAMQEELETKRRELDECCAHQDAFLQQEAEYAHVEEEICLLEDSKELLRERLL